MAPLTLGILPTTLARESLESASGCDGTAEIRGLITPLNGQAGQPRLSTGAREANRAKSERGHKLEGAIMPIFLVVCYCRPSDLVCQSSSKPSGKD
ncbi:uncharacterized protein BO66DRAFT_115576 [Aspergillus aculeatinus CBS 121060]|uniref:Uncharacterized protein n=1 Tax=Aspergillus aculeatinus CBS 121060 TaxID=1448322 RepID=A0ACD1H674_9EURO|nr:hypothetical protein BO66DRAFT_115576 [Aspergillus aculeatinus CBS 121060]RAH69136.1 hypothetical protein BO66DRAFT_115576 [Aspergillus aculeatinus CBS 121060]